MISIEIPIDFDICSVLHYSDVTWPCWYFKLLAAQLFLQNLIQANGKQISKLCICGLLWGESRESTWFPSQRASNADNLSMRYISLHTVTHSRSGVIALGLAVNDTSTMWSNHHICTWKVCCKNTFLYSVLLGWVGLWGLLWWTPSAIRKDHHGVSSGWSSVWHRSNTGLSTTQYEQIPIILGVCPFWLTPLFFRSITFWQAYG